MLDYDVADTDGSELPEQFTQIFFVEGEFSRVVLDKTIDNCQRAHIMVTFKMLGMLHAGTAM